MGLAVFFRIDRYRQNVPLSLKRLWDGPFYKQNAPLVRKRFREGPALQTERPAGAELQMFFLPPPLTPSSMRSSGLLLSPAAPVFSRPEKPRASEAAKSLHMSVDHSALRRTTYSSLDASRRMHRSSQCLPPSPPASFLARRPSPAHRSFGRRALFEPQSRLCAAPPNRTSRRTTRPRRGSRPPARRHR